MLFDADLKKQEAAAASQGHRDNHTKSTIVDSYAVFSVVEVEGLTGLSGLVDALEDAGNAEGLLRQNNGILVLSDSLKPVASLSDVCRIIALTVEECSAAAVHVGLEDVLTTVANAVNVNAVIHITAAESTTDGGNCLTVKSGVKSPGGLENDGRAVLHYDEAESGILDGELSGIPRAPAVTLILGSEVVELVICGTYACLLYTSPSPRD